MSATSLCRLTNKMSKLLDGKEQVHLSQVTFTTFNPWDPRHGEGQLLTSFRSSFSDTPPRLVLFDGDPKEEAKLIRMATALGCTVVTQSGGRFPTHTVLKNTDSYIFAFAAHCRQKSEFLPILFSNFIAKCSGCWQAVIL